jgi:serpin B
LNTIQFGNLTAEEVNQACKDLTELLTSMDRTVSLDLANAVWFSNLFSVRKAFVSTIENYYNGKAQALNFADPGSVQIINAWVEGKTNHKIKNLLGNISKDEIMFLINAIYFKGTWSQKFDPSQTSTRPFTGEDNAVQQVPMMKLSQGTLTVFHNTLFTLVDIPYGNRQFSMTIFLPMPGKKIADIVPDLSADSLASWLSMADSLTTDLRMPKFKLGWKSDLKENLKHLGMATEGFPNLIEERAPLEITKVIHQATIEVTEEGSEAAAATSVGIGVTSVPFPSNLIEINKPFIYCIREKHSKTILFIGQLFNPIAN